MGAYPSIKLPALGFSDDLVREVAERARARPGILWWLAKDLAASLAG